MKRSTLLLLALNLATFLLIYLIITQDDDAILTPEIKLVELLGAPQTITIEKGFPAVSTHSLTREDDSWKLTSPLTWPAAEYTVSRLIGRLRHIEVRRLFSIDEIKAEGETLADYGLDQPFLTIVVESLAGKVSLAFGAPTRDGRENYMLPTLPEGKKNEIWAANNSLLNAANLSTTEWMKPEFLRFPVYEIRAFGVRLTRGETLTKTRFTRVGPTDWNIVSPIRAPANPEAVRVFLNKLSAAKALRFITDPEESKNLASRLESPALRVNLEGSFRGQAVVVGKPLEEEGDSIRPAQVEGIPTVFLVDDSFIKLIANTEGRLRDRRLLTFDLETIGKVEIRDSNLKLSLHKLEDGRWEVLLLDSAGEVSRRPGDRDAIREFLSTMQSLEVISYISDAPSEEDLKNYGLEKPRHSLVLTDKDGKTFALRVGHYAEGFSGWYTRRDDAPFVFTTEETIPVLLAPSPLRFRQRLLERLPQAVKIKDIRLLDLEANASEIPIDRNATIALEPFVRNFTARDIVSEEYDKEGLHFRGERMPWRYELQAQLALPGGTEDENETRVYNLTERLGGRAWAGGSPAANLSFLLPIGLMDLLSEIIAGKTKSTP